MSEKYLVGKFVGEGELDFINFESGFLNYGLKKRIQK